MTDQKPKPLDEHELGQLNAIEYKLPVVGRLLATIEDRDARIAELENQIIEREKFWNKRYAECLMSKKEE